MPACKSVFCSWFGCCCASDVDSKLVETKNHAAIVEFFHQVPLVRRLPKDSWPLLASACVYKEFAAGEVVIKQGDVGKDFYLIREGEAKVTTKSSHEPEKQLSILRSQDHFGENALLRDEPRIATVTALTRLVTVKISRQDFQALGLSSKLRFANRNAVNGGVGPEFQRQIRAPTPKKPQERRLIAEALNSNDLIQTMISGDQARIEQLIDCAWKEEVEEGKEIITQGDINANFFYVVQSGEFSIVQKESKDKTLLPDSIVNVSANDSGTGEERVCVECSRSSIMGFELMKVGPAGSFGELALMFLVPRAATVTATKNSVVWVIHRANFKNILLKVSDKTVEEYIKFLDKVELLDVLLVDEKKELAKALTEMHFKKDEQVLKQGEPGNTFYILLQGEVSVIKDGKEVAVLQSSNDGDTAHYFGEQALLNRENRTATVQVRSDQAKVLALDRDAFDFLLGPLHTMMKEARENGGQRKSHRRSREDLQQACVKRSLSAEVIKRQGKIRRSDLVKVGLLGCGGFGIVELVEHASTGSTYALKGLSKGYIVKTAMQESVKNEKTILLLSNSQFIIMLYETFNSPQHLYFLMEPALGGEIYSLYNRKGFHGKEYHAKYYSAGVVMAFVHLHEKHVIYRDLKPENLLLNSKGHLKLTDMGLAKIVIGKTFTTCGTPDYFAPELIKSLGHSTALDWWTLGILVFELLTGAPPFEANAPNQIYSKVMKGIGAIPFPPNLEGAPGSLIKELLQEDPSKRLPVRPGGVANLKKHDWYAKFDWDEFLNLSLEVPYKPVVKSRKDISNFSVDSADLPDMVNYVDDGSGWDKDFASSE